MELNGPRRKRDLVRVFCLCTGRQMLGRGQNHVESTPSCPDETASFTGHSNPHTNEPLHAETRSRSGTC
ncbi:hypothetical protein MATL_G00231810 [Megalops atlanticus]|uniref:Uncharacterized protein n=1 Tax=Megalops atlanticus TaxID=7932 RepID=A0A9D3PI67_MEGAT|nr:hypothetical protein MATL_G00231810 [Megalops atlanticus]